MPPYQAPSDSPQARDGTNHDRQSGGDQFEMEIFFLTDDDREEDDSDGGVHGHAEGHFQEAGHGGLEMVHSPKRSRVAVSEQAERRLGMTYEVKQ